MSKYWKLSVSLGHYLQNLGIGLAVWLILNLVTQSPVFTGNWLIAVLILVIVTVKSSYRLTYNDGLVTTYTAGMATNRIDLYRASDVEIAKHKLIVHYPEGARFGINLRAFGAEGRRKILEYVTPLKGERLSKMIRLDRTRVSFQKPFGGADPFRSGLGYVEVIDNKLVITGLERGNLFAGKKSEYLDMGEIYDACRNDRTVTFRQRGLPENALRYLTFRHEEEAAAFYALLPGTFIDDAISSEADQAAYRSIIEEGGFPVITFLLILANVLAFVYTAILSGNAMNLNNQVLLDHGANFAPATVDGQWWRLLSATFLHGDLFHLTSNMLFLWVSGSLLERLAGKSRYLWLYLFTGVGASFATVLWQQDVLSVGASGAVMGLYGALFTGLALNRQLLPKTILRQQLGYVAFFIIYVLWTGISGEITDVTGEFNTDNAAHVGGLLAGMLFGLTLFRSKTNVSLSYAFFTLFALYATYHVSALTEPFGDEMDFRHFVVELTVKEKELATTIEDLSKAKSSEDLTALGKTVNDGVLDDWLELDSQVSSFSRLTEHSSRLQVVLDDYVAAKLNMVRVVGRLQSITSSEEADSIMNDMLGAKLEMQAASQKLEELAGK